METYYTPAAIASCYSNSLKVDLESSIIVLQGIYKPDTHNKLYSGFYYDRLVEQDNSSDILIKVKPYLRNYLQDNSNKLITLSGFLTRRISRSSSIELSLTVSGICKSETNTISQEEKDFWEIQRTKAQRGRRDIALLLKSELMAMRQPKIALVWAFSSCTKTEFYNALGNSNLSIAFDEYDANFGNVNELISRLKSIDGKYQAVALIRGGGSGLEFFNNNALLSYLVSMSSPVISAIGHAEDKHNVKLIADLVIDTPTALGKFFSDICEGVTAERERSKAVLIDSVKKQFASQIQTQQNQIDDLQKRLSVAASDKQQTLNTFNKQMQAVQQQLAVKTKEANEKENYIREREALYTAELNKLNTVHSQQLAASTAQINQLQQQNKMSDQRLHEEVNKVIEVYRLQNEALSSQLQSINQELQQKTEAFDRLSSEQHHNVSNAVLVAVSVSSLIIGMLLASLF